MKITLSSLPGAGSSTVARLLAKKLKVKRIDAGEIWDKLAVKYKKDVLGLSKLAEKNRKIDFEVDKKMLKYAKSSKDLILEGRLCGWHCYKNKIEAFKIWLKCPFLFRVRRIAQREKQNFAKVLKETKRREKSEIKRYKRYYHIDINDLSIYDLIIDSRKMKPAAIVNYILKKLKAKQKSRA